MENKLERKKYSLEEILGHESASNDPWRSAWAKAQKMLLNPEKFTPEEIIGAERQFLDMELGLDDLASRDEIVGLDLKTTVLLLSRHSYQHFDNLAEQMRQYSQMGAYEFFTLMLDQLYRQQKDETQPLTEPTIEQIVPYIAGWVSLLKSRKGIQAKNLIDLDRVGAEIAEEVLLLCYYFMVLHGYNESYPQGLGDKPDVGEKLSVKLEVQYLKDLATAVTEETGLEIPVDGTEVLPSGAIRGRETATRNILNRVKNVQQLLKLILISIERDSFVLIPEHQLPDLQDTLQDSYWLQSRLARQAFYFLISVKNKKRPGSPDKKKDPAIKRAFNQIERIAAMVVSPKSICDWLDMLMLLGGSGYEAQAQKLFSEMAVKVRNSPDFLDELCRRRMKNQDYAELGHQFVRADHRLDWQYQLVADSPVLLQRLFELIESPRADTFCTACTMVANLAVNMPQNPLVAALLQRLFPDTSAITDTVRATALRYMLESIAELKLRQRFFTTLLKTLHGSIPLSAQLQERFIRTMQLYSLVLGNEIAVTAPPREDADDGSQFNLLRLGEFPKRDLDTLREEILANRSIHISQQGNRLGQTGVDSQLEDLVAETRISRNSETKKYPLSLACFITVKLNAGNVVYFRMTKENQLLVRVMDKNIAREEIPVEKMDYLSKVDGLFGQEWHYFILCKLRDVFVRRKSDPPVNLEKGTDDCAAVLNDGENQNPDGAVVADTAGDGEQPTAPADTGVESNETTGADNHEQDELDGPVVPPDPFTQVREEHDPRLDITDRAIAEMQMVDLRKDSAAEAELARTATQRIADNLAKADKLLSPLREGKTLPDILPEDLTDLVLYQKIHIDGEDYFEAVDFQRIYPKIKAGEVSLDDLFVRTVRAFTQSLPYLKRYNAAPLSPGEQRKQAQIAPNATNPARPVGQRHLPLTIKKKQRRDDRVRLKITLFTDAGEGYGLSMADRRKVLLLEADDTPLNRAIFEKMRGREDLEIRDEVSRRVSKALERNIAGARKKLVDPRLNGREWRDAEDYFEKIAARMSRLAVRVAESEIERELELREKLQVIGEAGGTADGGPDSEPGRGAGTTTEESGAQVAGGDTIKLQLPQILTFAQTFNQGQFESLGKLIFKTGRRRLPKNRSQK